MTYASVLPQVYPYAADVPTHQAGRLARLLVEPGHCVRAETGEVLTASNGSSFACTSEPWTIGTTRVYLSETSYARLQRGGDLYERLPGLAISKREGR